VALVLGAAVGAGTAGAGTAGSGAALLSSKGSMGCANISTVSGCGTLLDEAVGFLLDEAVGGCVFGGLVVTGGLV